MVQGLKTLLAAVVAAASMSACSRSATPTKAPVLIPSLARQIQVAEQAGPGFLDYCPLQAGRASALFAVDVPGEPTATGWCETSPQRGPAQDTVTFRAHWDAIPQIDRSGTAGFTYDVPRHCSSVPARCVDLARQWGSLPP